MKVLVTGATGFVGSHVVRRLVQDGHTVRALARTPAKLGPLLDLMRVPAEAVEVAPGDMVDEEAVGRAVEDCEAVVHAAAVVSTSPDMDAEMERVNLAGARNVLGAAVAAACDPVVHVSSVAALFPFRSDPLTVDHPVGGDAGAYGRTKAACERFARHLQDEGHPVITLYPSGIMGPDDWTGSINLASYKVWLERGIPKAKGFGAAYVDVRDLAEIIAVSMKPGVGPARYLATGTYLDADGLVAALDSVTGAAKSFPFPRPLFWIWGKLGDAARRVGRDLVVTSDGYRFMFGAVPGDDTPTTEATGVVFRPFEETLRDTLRWMYEAGHARAEDLGRLVADGDGAAR